MLPNPLKRFNIHQTLFRPLYIERAMSLFLKKIQHDARVFSSDVRSTSSRLLMEFRADKHWAVIICALFLAAVAYRAYFVSVRPLGYDEICTLKYFAKRSFKHVLSDYSQSNNHILHSFFLHIFYKSTKSWQPWVLRSPAFISGIFVLGLSFLASRVLYKSKSVSVLTLALVGSCGVYVLYASNARGYGLLTVFFLCMVILGQYLLKKQNLAAWRYFTWAAILGMYTTPSMMYAIAAVYVWMVVNAKLLLERRAFVQLIKSLGASCLWTVAGTLFLYSPVFVRIYVRDQSDIQDLQIFEQVTNKLSFQEFLPKLTYELIPQYWSFFNMGFVGPVVALILLGAVLACILKKSRPADNFPLLIACLCASAVFLLFQRVSQFDRVWTPFVVVYLMTAAGGIVYSVKKVLGAPKRDFRFVFAALVVLIFLANVFYVLNHKKVVYYDSRIVDGNALMRFLKGRLKSEDRILTVFSSGWDAEVFNYYLKIYGLEQWAADYRESNVAQTYSQPIKSGDIYMVVFDNKDNCYQYYHCEGSWNPDQLLPLVEKGSYRSFEPAASFTYTKVYYLKHL